MQTKFKLILSFTLGALILPLITFCQTTNDIKDRKIKATYLQTIDQRKGQVNVKNNLTYYDKHGNTLETFELDKDSNITAHETFKYNHHNDEIENIIFDSIKILKKIVSEYDKWNNIKLRTTFDKDNVLIEKTISIYNTNNYKTEENTFDKDGKLVRKWLWNMTKKEC
nr:hypothetical protein [Bacteroidota bacterium]